MLDSRFRSPEERRRLYFDYLKKKEREEKAIERIDAIRRKKFKKGLVVALVTGTAATGAVAKNVYDYTAKKMQPVKEKIEKQIEINEEQIYSKEYLVSHKGKKTQKNEPER